MSKLADKVVAGVGSWAFDKDFSIFTWLLSVLAIYLTVFILISQNKEQKQFGDWLKEDLINTKQINAKLDKLLKEKK